MNKHKVTIILGRDGMGDDSTEADFESWVEYVTAHTDSNVTVDARLPRDVQDDNYQGEDDDVEAAREKVQDLWAQWCAEGAPREAAGEPITIGAVLTEWSADEGDLCPLCAYISVAATIDGRPVKLGTMVGVPEALHGRSRASGAGVRPFLTVWWADASDWQDVTANQRDAVQAALLEAAPRLWRETTERRVKIG